MYKILFDDELYTLYKYESEAEFEKHIIEHSKDVFGDKSIYFDVKKRIGTDNILSIPDGYLIDLSFSDNPKLYIIENELVIHDPYRHIGQQLLKFAISYKASWRKIKSFLLNEILSNEEAKTMIEQFIRDANYRNIDALLENLIYEKPVSAIIIIDEITDDITNVLNQLTMKTDIIEFQTFCSVNDQAAHIHYFTPFQEDIQETIQDSSGSLKPDELDTIVVPANEAGFTETFLGEDCWYAIRISSAMLDRIKYIAAYQTAPISAITYYAAVKGIEKYKNSEKYVVYFKEKAKAIGPIKLVPKGTTKAPRCPRYTNFERLIKAKNLDEAF